jgi:hypothetical protein
MTLKKFTASGVKNLGSFSRYEPSAEAVAKDEHLSNLVKAGVVFARNERGDDLYETVTHNGKDPSNKTFIVVDADGRVVLSINDHGCDKPGIPYRQRLWPIVGSVSHLLEVSGLPKNDIESEYNGLFWNGARIFAEQKEYVTVVTATQARLALFHAGLMDRVKQVVEDAAYEPIRIYFEYAATWERGNPYVQALAIEIGLTDDEIDALFEAAAKL